MDLQNQKKIQLLPEHIIDQIKAGEVIERPSTLLKEIIENSVDAGSSRIDIHLVNNGLDLISITDNGSGISGEDLPLAFCRHATSKIDRFEDIYHLHSYGFRGEALASIASISKVTCQTLTETEKGLIKIEGGETLTHQNEKKKNSKTGTNLFIRELFYNTPVRMKFIQSKTSERNQLKKILNAFLLTHPEIEFNIKWDDKDKVHYPAYDQENVTKRIKDVLFAQKDVNFFEASNHYDGVGFKIFLTHESSRGNAHKSFYLFINERYVNDIQIHKIILNSAAPMWPEGETGNYVAFLDVPSDEIDVNIHPNKTVVKLFRAPKVFSVVSSSIKHALSQTVSLNAESPAETSPQESLLPLETGASDFKNIEYKAVDFNSDQGLDGYFENLHKKTNFEQAPINLDSGVQYLTEFTNDLNLIKLNGQLYILSSLKLVSLDLLKILKAKNLNEEIVPLLVSKPIKVTTKLSHKKLSSLMDMGFEVDQLDASTVVLRTFPKQLQRHPYIKIVEQLILSKEEDLSFDDMDLSKIVSELPSKSHISDLLTSSPTTELISQKVLLPFTENDLKVIYEKK